ncbi:MAG: aminoglycoside phosphotransferase family protein [Chloroflexi bacterium]|nr:aminoglycoside phosphotransferase family protein [Chloroflexota bacterium]
METYTNIFAEHLNNEAVHFFPELAASHVEVVFRSLDERSSATLYRYDIVGGEEHYPVMVKQHHKQAKTATAATQRPLRYKIDGNEKYELESQALMTIESYFKELNDGRFGFIRVLDTLPQYRALIMIESQDARLHTMVLSNNRLQRKLAPNDLHPVLYNAGAWLRHFHSLSPDETIKTVYETRNDYLETITSFTDFLTEQTGDHYYFKNLIKILHHYANDNLSERLPTGRFHGDFSTRNILVRDDSQVIVVDTLAKWHVPIYEDIGTFLTWFHINQLQVFTQGLSFDPKWIQHCEQAFLEGYFGDDPIPYNDITLFKILVLLDKWTSLVTHFSRRNWLWQRITNRVRERLSVKRFKAVLHEALDSLKTGEKYEPSR